jgi:uncharacterized repeat protein (TIGR02543 family)
VYGDRTLYAKWDSAGPGIVYYTVRFESNGGSAISSQTVIAGGKANKPEFDPFRSGFTFGGWYKDTALTIPWNFDSDTVNGDIELYAKWNTAAPGTITVAFSGFNDETIDLTRSTANDISRLQNQSLTVTVEGYFDMYEWYVDGDSWGYGWRDYPVYARDFSVGPHTLTVIVTKYGIPYSKSVTFRVAY